MIFDDENISYFTLSGKLEALFNLLPEEMEERDTLLSFPYPPNEEQKSYLEKIFLERTQRFGSSVLYYRIKENIMSILEIDDNSKIKDKVLKKEFDFVISLKGSLKRDENKRSYHLVNKRKARPIDRFFYLLLIRDWSK